MTKKKFLDRYHRLFGSKHLYKFNRMLLRMGMRGMGIAVTADFSLNGETHFLKSNAGRFRTVFDVGANRGDYALQVQAFNRAATIYGFEPHPASFRELQQIGRRINLRAYNLALGKTSGEAVLYDYKAKRGSGHASLHKGVMEDIHGNVGQPIPVAIETIDQFAEQNDIEFIDFLKIDTEGNEYDVLSGARHMLAGNRIKAIQFEFNKMNVVSRIFFKDFQALLVNYKLYRMLKDGLIPMGRYRPIKCEFFAHQNIVAINNAHLGAFNLG